MIENLGQIKAIHAGTTAPTNTKMLWYDENVGVNKHKYYDTVLESWELLAPIPLSSNVRADNIVFSTAGTLNIEFTSNLGSIDSNVVLLVSGLDINGEGIAPTITNKTKSGFTAYLPKAGTLSYNATLKQ